jgi:heme-degrading monooxygenase HmoA
MTVLKINAITVPADSGDELARRFAARAGAIDNQDGFEGFKLQPTDGRTIWLVVTRWRDEAAFEAWLRSPAFGTGTALRPRAAAARRPARLVPAASCGPTRSLTARPGETPHGQKRAVGGMAGRCRGDAGVHGRVLARMLAGAVPP